MCGYARLPTLGSKKLLAVKGCQRWDSLSLVVDARTKVIAVDGGVDRFALDKTVPNAKEIATSELAGALLELVGNR